MFDNIRLPVEIEQGSKGGPLFQTSIVELSSGNEQRNEDWIFPRQVWDIGYGVQNQSDYNACRDFFYARHGRSHGFLFKDWSDYSVTGQLLGTGDAAIRVFMLIKTYEAGSYSFTRRITRPVTASLVVKVSGVTQTINTDYIFGAGGWIRFATAPTGGATITADFEFDVPMRFDVDIFPLVLDWVGAATISSLTIIEIRDDYNAAPTAVHLTNSVSPLIETTSTTSHVKIAAIDVDDDPFGQDVLAVTGADAASFEIVGTLDQMNRTGAALYLKAGVVLNYLLKTSYAVTVTVDDPSVGIHPAAHVDLTLNLTQVNKPPTVSLINLTISEPLTDATGILSLGANPSVDDNVVIGTTTYLFKSAPTTGANEIKIGTLTTNSIDNLIAAINHAAGGGSLYGSATVVNPDVAATRGAGHTMHVAELVAGHYGNLLATTTTISTSSWAHVTLTGATTDTSAPLHVADVVATDDTLGLRALTLTGTDAAQFALSGSLSAGAIDPATGRTSYAGASLQTNAGLDYSTQKVFHVNVEIADSGLSSPPQGTAAFTLSFGIVPGTITVSTPGTHNVTVPSYTTLEIELWGPGAGGNGTTVNGTNGSADTTITSKSLVAGRGLAPVVGSNIGGHDGHATGGDTNLSGKPGNAGIVYSATLTGTWTSGRYLFAPPSFQFYTAKGGDAGDGFGGGLSTTGDSWVISSLVGSNKVSGAAATTPGGAGAGSVQYGITYISYVYLNAMVGSGGGGSGGGGSGVVPSKANAFGTGRPSGGGGAKLIKTYTFGVTPGAPNPGDILAVVIGSHGVGGVSFTNGGDGFDGQAKFTWS